MEIKIILIYLHLLVESAFTKSITVIVPKAKTAHKG